MVLKRPQGLYRVGFQDFIRLIGLLLMEILVGYLSLHNSQVHLSHSAESLFILLNNDFSLRFPTPVWQRSLCTFSDQTPV